MPRKLLPNGKRNYALENRIDGKKNVKNRAKRNAARRDAMRAGLVRKGDGKEIHHKQPLSKGGSNAKSNRQVLSREANRKRADKISSNRK